MYLSILKLVFTILLLIFIVLINKAYSASADAGLVALTSNTDGSQFQSALDRTTNYMKVIASVITILFVLEVISVIRKGIKNHSLIHKTIKGMMGIIYIVSIIVSWVIGEISG